MEKIKDILLKLFRLENVAKNLTGYVEARLELFKLEIKTDIAKALTKAISYMFLGLVGFMFLLFLSIAFAYFLNTILENEHSGFWIVGGFYGLIFFVFLFNIKSINTFIERQILKASKQKEP